jgi:hypothetical protein
MLDGDSAPTGFLVPLFLEVFELDREWTDLAPITTYFDIARLDDQGFSALGFHYLISSVIIF